MPVTQAGIIYSVAQNHARRIVIPTNDNSEISSQRVHDGEALLVVALDDYLAVKTSIADIDALITQSTGKAATSSRCAVIDAGGTVVQLIDADPAIDSVPNCQLVQSDVGEIGDLYANGVFTAPGSGI